MLASPQVAQPYKSHNQEKLTNAWAHIRAAKSPEQLCFLLVIGDMKGFETTFNYEGKEHLLQFNPHWKIEYPPGTGERWIFDVYINRYYLGGIVRDSDGYWFPMKKEINSTNLPFELQAHDFSVMGEMLEDRLPEYFVKT